MAQLEKLNGTLQENIISLLAHDDVHGKIIAQIVKPQLFEGEYRTIAERAIDYWERYGEAPKAHMPDLVDDIVGDKSNRKGKTYIRILNSMADLIDHINVGYVMDQVHVFTRMQRLKDAIIKSAEQLNAKAEVAVEEVEKIWGELLKVRETAYESATNLTDFQELLDWMEVQYSEFICGIGPLDKAGIVPARETVLLLLGAAKRGKSWFLIHVGAHAIMMRHKVLHITLEMSEPQVLQRYYMRLFGITRSDRYIQNRVIELEDGKIKSIGSEEIKTDYTLTGVGAAINLEKSVESLQYAKTLLRIKRFATRSVTIDDIEAYIDSLEVDEGFIPDMIILDYVAITKIDSKNPRIGLGRAMEEFRAMNIRRKTAGVTVGQLSKAGAEAMTAGATNIAEDWSQIGTADITLVFSSTDAEKTLGLGRISVTNARDARDNFRVLVTQNYVQGQFALDAVRLPNDYQDMLDDLKLEYDLGDDESEEPEDD